MRPFTVDLPILPSAREMPLCLSHRMALSSSPEVSVRASLQSIIPTPVFSRRVLTCSEVIVIGLLVM